ncbi:hypothetical protein SPURM210S_01404 [Streptomyces purpurascens]
MPGSVASTTSKRSKAASPACAPEVVDPAKVDEAALKAAGAHGVVKMGTAIQVVIGTDADPIAAEIEDLM